MHGTALRGGLIALLVQGLLAAACSDPAAPATMLLVNIEYDPAQYEVDQFRIASGPVADGSELLSVDLPEVPGALFGGTEASAVILVPRRWENLRVRVSVRALRRGNTAAHGSTNVYAARGAVNDVYVSLQLGNPACNNDVREADEVCDGSDFGGEDCRSLIGLDQGTLRCTDRCTLDVSGCYQCGNSAIEGPEECDADDFGLRTCQDYGYEGGSLTCTAECRVDPTSCEDGCGNGRQEPGEACDGEDFGGQTCLSVAGRQQGQLLCTERCFLDRSGCHTCGDNVIEGPEECDAEALGGRTCVTEGFGGGTLRCSETCTLDRSLCDDGCGNGVLDNAEACDGPDLGGATCASVTGLSEGALRCTDQCTLNTAECHECGNGLIEGTESCDGTDHGGASCESRGYDGGSLTCSPACALDESGCTICGDAVCDSEAGEDPVLCPADCGWIQISAGGMHSCGLRGDGRLYCWGRNDYGQLGTGSTQDRFGPVPVLGGVGVTWVGAGATHTCFVRGAAGTILCMGRNNSGQLGDGTQGDRSVPASVLGPAGFTQVSAGDAHTCAVQGNGSAWCWGSNTNGRLGDGTTTTRLSPVVLSSLSGVAGISAGVEHSCAFLGTGAAYCWGKGTDGRLGDGSSGDELQPSAVSNLTGVVSIAAGNQHSCAVTDTGGAWCWGNAADGRLGTGGTNTSVPMPVQNLTDARQIATGDAHTCASTLTGGAACWGLGVDGQLGTGLSASSPVPVPVLVPSGVLGVSTGPDDNLTGHGCAWLDSGGALCWGAGNFGQLGDALGQNAPTPVPVIFP